MQIKIYQYKKYTSINIESKDINLVGLMRDLDKSIVVTRSPQEYQGRLEFSCEPNRAQNIIKYIADRYF